MGDRASIVLATGVEGVLLDARVVTPNPGGLDLRANLVRV